MDLGRPIRVETTQHELRIHNENLKISKGFILIKSDRT